MRIAWRDVWLGGFITAVLFDLGKFLLGFYLGRSSVTSAYRAAGSLVVVLLWVYSSRADYVFWQHAIDRGSTPNRWQPCHLEAVEGARLGFSARSRLC